MDGLERFYLDFATGGSSASQQDESKRERICGIVDSDAAFRFERHADCIVESTSYMSLRGLAAAGCTGLEQ